ncbi:MAG: hypothetical protein ACLRTQ_07470 [Candidatus Borkfalkia sp.]
MISAFSSSARPAKVYSLHKEEVSTKIHIGRSQGGVYFRLEEKMNKIEKPRKLGKCGHFGINWGSSGRRKQRAGTRQLYPLFGHPQRIGATEMSDGKLDGADFVEANVCPGGCVGGVLNVENPFIARNKMRRSPKR